jgi:hypothetical protein
MVPFFSGKSVQLQLVSGVQECDAKNDEKCVFAWPKMAINSSERYAV